MPGPRLLAHSRSTVTQKRHTLEDHLRGSEALARDFADVFGAAPLACYLALVHDVGKGGCKWQQRLMDVEPTGGRNGVPHKHAGTLLAASHLPEEFGAVVFGHHGGMPGRRGLKDALADAGSAGQHEKSVAEAIRRVAEIVPEIHPDTPPALPEWYQELPADAEPLARDLLLRMVFSCVVDADSLDTAVHFDGLTKPRLRPRTDFAALSARYENRRKEYLAARDPAPVDAWREEVYRSASAAADGHPGMYVLHVPTGGAKTMAAGVFALRHAAAHGKRRVVMAVPYISITDQNAEVYRELLDAEGEDPVVLEHHSAVDLEFKEKTEGLDKKAQAEAVARQRTAKIAAENWDAPFIVTTTVRLFESLFSRRPSDMRRLHRLADSVIVLDEVQALPDQLLSPILSVLRGLVDHFGATIVLASATQPTFWNLDAWQGLTRNDIVSAPARLFEALKRVRYEWRTGGNVTLDSIACEAAEHDQALTVVGTTRDAAAFHRHLVKHAAPTTPVIHLSTRMTSDHRRKVLARIKKLTKEKKPIQVVSTSLIEAGVDLDFPRVYRAWAPAESLQQAAGRCNRDDRLPDRGVVVVFQAEDAGQPKGASYGAALQATGRFFGHGRAFPDNLDALERYYPLRHKRQMTLVGGLGEEINDLRRKLDFPAVAAAFRMIDDVGRPVVVICEEEDRDAIEQAVAQLQSPCPCGPEVLRSLQPHMASLPRQEAEAALRSGLARPVIGDLLLWDGAYHEERGLDPEEPEDRTEYAF